MGKKIVLTGTTLTDLSAPKLATVDLIESSGSLLLIEPGHPIAAAPPSIADGAVLTNLFRENALAVVGSGTLADMDAQFSFNAANIAGKVVMEYTGKKGVHGYATQVDGQITSGVGVILGVKSGLRGFSGFKKATGHDIYYSVWMRNTRLSVVQNTVTVEHGSGANSEQNIVFRKDSIGLGDGSNQMIGSSGAVANALGPLRRSAGIRTANSSLDLTANIMGGQWGAPTGSYNNAVPSFRDDAPSWVLYRMYVEDLTISGRTYAQVDAIESALYSQAFGAGGRYANDTFTDPAVLP